MTTTINAVSGTGLTQTVDGSGIVKLQSNGVATNALAWATFGYVSSTLTVESSYNISSITRTNTGLYVANFTNAMVDNNYVTVGGASVNGSPSAQASTPVTFGNKANSGWGPRSTTQLGVNSYAGTAAIWVDPTHVSFAVFGN